MAILSHALSAAWSLLPETVLGCPLVTNGGLPVRSVREGFLVEALTAAGFPVTQNRLTAAKGSRIDDQEAATLLAGIAASESRIITYTAWVRALDAVRVRRLTPIDTVHRLARSLEKFTDLPGDEAEQLVIARRAIDHEIAKDSLTGPSANRIWRDAATSRRLQDRLDAVWMDRPRIRGRSSHLGLYATFLTIADPYSRDEGSVDALAAERVLREIYDAPVRFTDDDARDLWLTEYLTVAQPSLGRVSTSPRDLRPSFPLDQAIADRVSRLVTGAGASLVIPGSAVNAIEGVIDASALPLGLPHDWARKVMAIGHQLAELMTWEEATVDQWFLESLSGGRLRIAKGWRDEVSRSRKRSRRAEMADAVAFYQEPGPYLAGKLWSRVLRRSLCSEAEPDALEVWNLVHGVYVTAREQLKELSRYFPPLVSTDDPLLGGARTGSGRRRGLAPTAPKRSAIDDVLQTAIDAFGAEAVVVFWNSVARLPRRAPDPDPLIATWRTYVEAETARLGTEDPLHVVPPLSIPFPQVREWISFKGPLDGGSDHDDTQEDRS